MAPGKRPIRKVRAGGLGGAAATVLLWLADLIPGLDVPAPVAAALAALVTAGAAYLVPSPPGEPAPPHADPAPIQEPPPWT